MHKHALLAFSALALTASPSFAVELVNKAHADGGGGGNYSVIQNRNPNFGDYSGGSHDFETGAMGGGLGSETHMTTLSADGGGGGSGGAFADPNPGPDNMSSVETKTLDVTPQVLPANPGGDIASTGSGLTGATGVGAPMTSAAPPVIPKKDPNAPQVLPGKPTVQGSAGDIGGGLGGGIEGGTFIQGGAGGPGSQVICVFNCGAGGEGQPMEVGAHLQAQ